MRGYRVIGLAFASLIGCRSFQDITLIDDGGTTCPSIDANPQQTWPRHPQSAPPPKGSRVTTYSASISKTCRRCPASGVGLQLQWGTS